MVQSLFDEQDPDGSIPDVPNEDAEESVEPLFVPLPFEPPSVDENIRRGGLAWSAGIVFFSAIAFMLFLGWLADWLLGSSPWGLVGGIILGSIIGFIQFFRISSQIYRPGRSDNEIRPLLSNKDDDDPL